MPSSSSVANTQKKNLQEITTPQTSSVGDEHGIEEAGAVVRTSPSSFSSSSTTTTRTTTPTPHPTVQLIEIEIFETTTLRCSVQFLSSNKLSLYGIIEGIFDLFLHKATGQAIYSQVWMLKDKSGQEYCGPFPDSTFKEGQKQCCPESPTPITHLKDFQVGFSMDLQCDAGTETTTTTTTSSSSSSADVSPSGKYFTWKVKDISSATDEHRINARKFPRRTPPPPSTIAAPVAATASSTARMLSACVAAVEAATAAGNDEIEAPTLVKRHKIAITRTRVKQEQHSLLPAFLTAEEIEGSMRVRRIKEQTIETVWNERLNKPMLAQPPMWRDNEKKAICLLQYSGLTFAPAWSLYLEPSLLNRTKTACSVMWYSQKAIIAECDVLHKEKHWLHKGGRLAGETELPSKETLIERACHILRACREAELQGMAPGAKAGAGLRGTGVGVENGEGIGGSEHGAVGGLGNGKGNVNGTTGARKRRRGLGRADDSDDDLFDGEDW